jgi:hypothetical protein
MQRLESNAIGNNGIYPEGMTWSGIIVILYLTLYYRNATPPHAFWKHYETCNYKK